MSIKQEESVGGAETYYLVTPGKQRQFEFDGNLDLENNELDK